MNKKRILIPLALLLALTGCFGENPDVGFAESTDTPSSYLEESAPSVPEQSASAELDFKEKLQMEAVEEALTHGELGQLHAPPGYTLSPDQLTFISVGTASFDMTISNGTAQRTFPLEVRYNGDILGEPGDYAFRNLNIGWGCFYAIDEATIALTTPKELRFLSADNFSDTGLIIRSEQLGEGDSYFAGVAYHPDLGYVAPCVVDGVDSISYFNNAGELQGIESIQQEYTPGTRLFWHNSSSDNRGYGINSIHFSPDMTVLDLDSPVILLGAGHYGGNVFFCSPTDHALWVMNKYDTAQDGEETITLYTTSLWGSSFLPFGSDKSGLALRNREGKLQGYMYFDCRDLPLEGKLQSTLADSVYQLLVDMSPGYYGADDRPPPTELTPLFMTAMDPIRNIHQWSYSLDNSLLDTQREPVAVSPDGRYRIMEVLSDGGGDGYWGYWVIEDSVDGQIRYLCKYGTIPFAGQDIQFLSNSTIAVVYNYTAILYSSDTGEKRPIRDDDIPSEAVGEVGVAVLVEPSVCVLTALIGIGGLVVAVEAQFLHIHSFEVNLGGDLYRLAPCAGLFQMDNPHFVCEEFPKQLLDFLRIRAFYKAGQHHMLSSSSCGSVRSSTTRLGA